MPELLDHIGFLSQEIGPRPAGTEEEQQAALYITEVLQKDAGLAAVIEDFNSEANEETPKAICALFTLAITIPAMFFPAILAIPSLLVTAIMAALFALETFDRPILSKMFARGVSQNVVARYEPGYSPDGSGARRRKIVLLANYDSGKVRFELNSPLISVLPLLQKLALYAMIFIPLFLLVRYLFFLHAVGILAVFLNIIVGIALFFVLLPIVLALLHKFAAYNEAANCNASGVAVLLEVARRVANGRIYASGLSGQLPRAATIHGEESARAAGLVPEGAQIVYAAGQVKAPEQAPHTEEERLMSAKAAIAAMTGRPVEARENNSVADNLVRVTSASGEVAPVDAAWLEAEAGALREAASLREAGGVSENMWGGTSNVAQGAAQAVVQAGEAVGGQVAGAIGAAGNVVAAGAWEAAGSAAVSDDDYGAYGDYGEYGYNDDDVASAAGSAADYGAANVASAVNVAGAVDSADATLSASHTAGNEAAASTSALEAPSAVPDWFKKAQENAKKPKDEGAPKVQRSRYADALDAAVSESASHFKRANSVVNAETEERLQKIREEILEVSAPQIAADSAFYEGVESEGLRADAELEEFYNRGDLGSTREISPINVDDLRGGSAHGLPEGASIQEIQAAGQNALASVIPALSLTETGSVPFPQSADEEQNEETATTRNKIILPDIGVSASNLTPVAEMLKQHAPLADAGDSSQKAAHGLLSLLPSIDLGQSEAPLESAAYAYEGSDPAAFGAQNQHRFDLRNSLPSLSGPLQTAPAGATGTFAPISDELIRNTHPDDIYIDDADDSVYEEGFTETGAFAGDGYVDMPKSRTQRIFGKLGRNKGREYEGSPQRWLDVEDDFDAQSVGASRGGWESFQEEPQGATRGRTQQRSSQRSQQRSQRPVRSSRRRADNGGDYDDWEGGAFSSGRFEEAADPYAAYAPNNSGNFAPNLASVPNPASAPNNSGNFATNLASVPNPASTPNAAYAPNNSGNFEPQGGWPVEYGVDEMQQIEDFHNPHLDTEIWFVALGSELANCGGMRAFLAEHEQDLRGSIIINLRALGAGDLSYLTAEGKQGKEGASSRMKRYVTKAAQAIGIRVESSTLLWSDSATTLATKKGMPAISIVGMDGPKPAYFSQGDDVIENIEESILRKNVEFVVELLKNI
ncbi:MAG: aminopeptidase [Eggerthellaceae bacterium]|nr:aminopeptidase [Eggerthellaceae bacterium]